MAESPSDDQFRVLQREIRDSIRRNHPNPNRVGCVGTEKLAEMAKGPLATDDPAYSHVMECSPCYEELMDLTAQVEIERSRSHAGSRRTTALLATAAGVVLMLALSLFLIRRPAATGPDSPPKGPTAEIPKPPDPVPRTADELTVAVLNLESDSPTRGAGENPTSRGLQRLARKRMDLRIYLPLGMEKGRYEVSVYRNSGPVLMQMSGEARIQDGLTVLRIQLDFSNLPPGTYRMRYRREGGSWQQSSFLLR